MVSQPSSPQLQQMQRVQVGIESQLHVKRLKISVENYDDGLGWYAAGSLTIPMSQLPLLEQALQELREEPVTRGAGGEKIIQFPGLRS